MVPSTGTIHGQIPSFYDSYLPRHLLLYSLFFLYLLVAVSEDKILSQSSDRLLFSGW